MSSTKEKVSKQLDFGATPTPAKPRRHTNTHATASNKFICTQQFILLGLVMTFLTLLTFYTGVKLGGRFAGVHEPVYEEKKEGVHEARDSGDGSNNSGGNLRGIHSQLRPDPLDYSHTINPLGLSMEQFLRSSLSVTDHKFMTTNSDTLNFDSNTIIGGWIYLNPDVPNNNMRTIVSNKDSGCDASVRRNGFAMFINSWLGKDLKVYIEYGNTQSGCNKIKSSSSIRIGKWTHIAALIAKTSIKIFIDGVESGGVDLGTSHGIILQTSSELRLGHYNEIDNGDLYSLDGNISTFTVVNYDDTSTSVGKSYIDSIISTIQDVNKVRSQPGLSLLYPLWDAAHEVHDSKVILFHHFYFIISIYFIISTITITIIIIIIIIIIKFKRQKMCLESYQASITSQNREEYKD